MTYYYYYYFYRFWSFLGQLQVSVCLITKLCKHWIYFLFVVVHRHRSKFGINRERAPFVFTPEMAYVMRGTKIPGSTYRDFEELCCSAYNMLRRRADLFINLFILMVPAAMPELLQKNDITYLREQLSLELSSQEADIKFISEINNSLKTVSRRIDNWLHNLKHKKN